MFQDLWQRGLKKVVMVVSDDFPGMEAAIKSMYPLTDHQLCYVHLERNVRRKMEKKDAMVFNQELKQIRYSVYYEQGLKHFNRVCDIFQDKYKTFIDYIPISQLASRRYEIQQFFNFKFQDQA